VIFLGRARRKCGSAENLVFQGNFANEGLIWTNWTSVRTIKEGKTTNDLFTFLTTDPNDVVAPIHPKAMPVILTKPDEIESWLTAPQEIALKLQRPLPDGTLRVVARGQKEDGALTTGPCFCSSGHGSGAASPLLNAES